MRQSDLDMAEHIFATVEQLMAKEGLHNLSMHKIAKAANISAGTIYIYFANKEQLLRQFAHRVFMRFFHALEKDHDETLDFFQQYHQMWWNIWHFLQKNPDTLLNMQQYQSLPGFTQIIEEERQQGFWRLFCEKGQQAGVLAPLSSSLLFAMGLDSAIRLAMNQVYLNDRYSTEMLEAVISRTWLSITNY